MIKKFVISPLLLALVVACSHEPVQGPFLTESKSTDAWEYPAVLKEAIVPLRSHYPALRKVSIKFAFSRAFSGAVMQAQPQWPGMLRPGQARRYQIEMKPYLLLRDEQDTLALHRIPQKVLIGWLGHELGHIADYENKGFWEMIDLGLGYLTSAVSQRATEQRADSIATRHGLGPEIIAVKHFILTEKAFPVSYRDKIRNLYPSTDHIEALLAE
jgi:hypothetical protein